MGTPVSRLSGHSRLRWPSKDRLRFPRADRFPRRLGPLVDKHRFSGEAPDLAAAGERIRAVVGDVAKEGDAPSRLRDVGLPFAFVAGVLGAAIPG